MDDTFAKSLGLYHSALKVQSFYSQSVTIKRVSLLLETYAHAKSKAQQVVQL